MTPHPALQQLVAVLRRLPPARRLALYKALSAFLEEFMAPNPTSDPAPPENRT